MSSAERAELELPSTPCWPRASEVSCRPSFPRQPCTRANVRTALALLVAGREVIGIFRARGPSERAAEKSPGGPSRAARLLHIRRVRDWVLGAPDPWVSMLQVGTQK